MKNIILHYTFITWVIKYNGGFFFNRFKKKLKDVICFNTDFSFEASVGFFESNIVHSNFLKKLCNKKCSHPSVSVHYVFYSKERENCDDDEHHCIMTMIIEVHTVPALLKVKSVMDINSLTERVEYKKK